MDDVTRQKLMFSLVGFNITVVLYQLIFNSDPFSYARLGIGMAISAVVGGIIFGVMHFLSR